MFIVATMRPFLVTELQAGKLPRWGLLLLCVLYIVPGFAGRDPWRQADAADFGIALTMARGGPTEWLMPSIAGEPVTENGPLPFWIAALAARAVPLFSEHAMVRVCWMVALGLMLACFWYSAYELAKRPGLQPEDPFGAAASRVDFGRAIADSALLVLLATLGAIARLHETTAEAAQVGVWALFLYGAARAPDRPGVGGLIAGGAIAATVMTRGLLPAAALACTAIALPMLSRQYRLVARHWLPAVLGTGLAGGAIWPVALATSGPVEQTYLAGWLAWNMAQLEGLSLPGLADLARRLPWFLWPAWPMAAWALLRWRGRLGEPAVALPLLNLAAIAALALLTSGGDEDFLLPATLPVAMLAAIGLPTLRRSVVSLIDWFAVMVYCVIGFAVWAYWVAFVTGFPPRMAFSAARIAPGFEPTLISADIVLGMLATVAWVLLVRWRISRHPPMIWRAVVLSCGGLVLAWFLLMTLWLPAFNQRNTYREVSQKAAAAIEPGYDCVGTRGLGRAQRASLHYFGGLRFGAPGQRCGWLLAQDEGPLARTAGSSEPGWTLRWEGSRPRDRDERLRLYRRAD